MTEIKQLKIVRVFDAPVERVWAAWSQPELIRKWWGPENFTAPSIDMDFRVGGAYLFCMHGQPGTDMPAQDFWSGGRYEEIEPMKKIVYLNHFADKEGNAVSPSVYGMSELPDEMKVIIEFEPIDHGKTKLTLTHTGAPEGIQLDNMTTGWNQSLDKMAESFVDMAEGSFEVDKDNLEVRITRIFNASPERLWEAHTDPEQVEQWWNDTKVDELDVRVGGKWRFVSGANGEHCFRGEYLKVDKPHALVRTFEYEPYAGHISVETATFEPAEGGKTKLTMVSKFENLNDLEGMVGSGMERGSRAGLDRLAKVVEER